MTEIQVKAQIAHPAEGAIVPANTSVCVHGAAWACDAEITKVELSADGGATWNEAKLVGESTPNAWRLWQFDWQTPSQAGKHTLMARATDSLGRTQPAHRDPDRSRYSAQRAVRVLRRRWRRRFNAESTEHAERMVFLCGLREL